MKPISCGKNAGPTESLFAHSGIVLLISWLVLLCSVQLKAQEQTAPGKYRIVLKDKNNNPFSLERPEEFLSSRAILRRQKQGIPLDWKDLPVSPVYLDSLRATGAGILTVSKWLNAVTIENTDFSILQHIMRLSFVKPQDLKSASLHAEVQIIPFSVSQPENIQIDYGLAEQQITIHNGDKLHDMGYTGEGMQIAAIDAGFYNVDVFDAFYPLWENNRILGTRDFVSPGSSVYREHTHGMLVLSVISSEIPGIMAGTSPGASFWLLRSEDVSSEYLIEEDNWIAAAEFADSVGADIINTSLGYSIFSDQGQDHTYEDMDGNTTRISVAADIAASRGMLVVVSAGNEGNKLWRYISAPADADSVLAIGAIDSSRAIGAFSSQGPTYDGRLKPDVCAMGVNTYAIGPFGIPITANGTSLAAPVITGLAACLWQAFPQAGMMDIQTAIKKSADRYENPDNLYGYGIPDFDVAYTLLKIQFQPGDTAEPVLVYPNPFAEAFYIQVNRSAEGNLSIDLYDCAGKKVYSSQEILTGDENYIRIGNGLPLLPRGVYLLRVRTSEWQETIRLLKF